MIAKFHETLSGVSKPLYKYVVLRGRKYDVDFNITPQAFVALWKCNK